MKHKDIKTIFFNVLRKNAGISLLLLFVVVGVVVTNLLPPQILKRIIDENLTPRNSTGLLTFAGYYILVIVMIGSFEFMKEAILTVLGQKVTKEIRYVMIEKLEKINHRFFTSNGTGTIVSRFINDVDSVSSMFTSGIVGMVIDCFKIIGIIISIWIFGAKLGLITLLLLPIIAVITRFFQKRMLAAQIKNRILVSKVNNHLGESIKNILTIKAFSKEDYMEQKYTQYLTDNYQTIEKVNFYDSVFPPIIQITRAAVIGFVIVISSEQLNYLGISLGMIAASIELISNLFAPIEELGMEFQNIQQAVSGIRRVNDYLKEAEDDEKDTVLTADRIISDSKDVTVQFETVTFQYEEGTEILKAVNLKIHPFEKVAFVGRTGVGKSTLFKLVLGLLKPSKGGITLNGVDVYQISNREKRKIFGYVDQNFPLISGTVAEQISLRDNSITPEQIETALDYVGMLEFVRTLNNGWDTPVTETLFSQGQKQLLSIARAIVTNPPILLLDEITSNLDSITEKKIVSVLHKAENNRMILSISHRLSSVLSSDTVIILENGSVKNSGTPELLLQQDEWFRGHLELENLTWSQP